MKKPDFIFLQANEAEAVVENPRGEIFLKGGGGEGENIKRCGRKRKTSTYYLCPCINVILTWDMQETVIWRITLAACAVQCSVKALSLSPLNWQLVLGLLAF